MLDNGFQRGKIDRTLFIKRHKSDTLLVQVYVNDVIFGSTKKELCIAFEKLMHENFPMSSMGELTFFLGLQKFRFTKVKTASTPTETHKPLLKDEDGKEVDVHMYRYQVNPKVSHLHVVNRIFRNLKGQPKLGLWYPKDSPFGLIAYTDSDYAGASLDKKFTTGGKAKKSVRLMMEKLFGMELELILFWSTAMAKTINGEAQLHARVDGKEIVITESSVRRDLRLADEEGVDCLPNSTIFEQLALMGPKTTAWNEFSSTMASAIICLATNQKFNFSKLIFDSMIRNLDNVSGKGFSGRVTPLFPTMVVQNQSELGEGSAMPTDPHHTPTILQPSSQPQKKQKPRKPKRKDTQVPQPSDPTDNVADEAVHKELGDSLVRAATTASSLGAEQDSGNINKTQSKATPNESSSQGTNSGCGLECQETLGDTAAQTRFESNPLVMKEVLGKDAIQTGRIDVIDAKDEEIPHGVTMFKIMLTNEIFDAAIKLATKASNNCVTITTKEITLDQALEALKTSKPKVKGIVFQEPGKSTTTTTIYSQQSQDKGKGIMIEEPMKPKKKDLIRLDKEAAKKLQAEFDEEENLQEKKLRKKKEPILI
ncbi:uncharacterized mitochondrial protein-like protein [Tanacetum coccineum]